MFLSIWAASSYLAGNGYVGGEYVPVFSRQDNSISSFLSIFKNNVTVLAIHFFACVAAFLVDQQVNFFIEKRISHEEVVTKLEQGAGIDFTSRQQHSQMIIGKITMTVVSAFVLFSAIRQVIIISTQIVSSAGTLDIAVTDLMARAALHAFLELTVIFLPLAAAIILSRKGQENKLLAGAILSAMIAVPTLLLTAAIETWITGGLFQSQWNF